jgi:hypothetical protein
MNTYPFIIFVTYIEETRSSEDITDFFGVMDMFFEEGFYFGVIFGKFLWVDCDNVSVRVSTIICRVIERVCVCVCARESCGGGVINCDVGEKKSHHVCIILRSQNNNVSNDLYLPRIWESLGSTASLGSHGTEMAGYSYADASNFQ